MRIPLRLLPGVLPGAIQTDVELKLLAKSILQLRRIGCSLGAPGATAKGRLTKPSDLRIFPHQFESQCASVAWSVDSYLP